MIPTANEILLKLTPFDRQNYDEVSRISDTTPALEYVAKKDLTEYTNRLSKLVK